MARVRHQPVLLEGAADAEERVGRERAILQYVVDHVPGLIFWKDRSSTYLGCNGGFAALAGRPAAEMVGLRDGDLAWASQAEAYQAGDREVMDRGESVLDREEILLDADGNEKVILTSKVPMRDAGGTVIGVLGILFDITERKRAQVELQRAKEAAEEAARVRGQFLARMSHELRTPLTLILGPVTEALATADLPAATRALLEGVHRNGYRLYDLVNDVLDFSKAEAGRYVARREAADVVQLLSALTTDVRPLAASRGLSLTFDADRAEATCRVDRRMLERVALNLVGNALKFTPPGGSVTVSLRTEGELLLEVVDTGIGIAAEELSTLFQPFVQVDSSLSRRFEGTGLGLALVQQFVEAMGGRVEVRSEVGRGSTFGVRLPLEWAEADARDPRPVERRSERAAGRPGADAADAGSADEVDATSDRPRVLVVDDNAELRAFIAATLRPACAVATAADGQQAWDLLQGRRFDAVVSDVMMPGVDGLELVARIRAEPTLAALPVLLVTARGGTEETAQGLDVGADDYLAKPFSPTELRARVRSALRASHLQAALRDQARLAGMVDVSSSVLHNVGNVLNSVNVSAQVLRDRVAGSRVAGLARVSALLSGAPDPGRFLAEDARAATVLTYLSEVGPALCTERDALLEEIDGLRRSVAHLRAVIGAQQAVGRHGGRAIERVDVGTLVADALRLDAVDADPRVELVQRIEPGATLDTDRHTVLQILVNLLRNARQAVGDRAGHVTVSARRAGDRVLISVTDDGHGIAPEHVPHLFELGFTTRADGNGFGLHVSACDAQALGGSLSAASDGLGHGAEFMLDLPARAPAPDRSLP